MEPIGPEVRRELGRLGGVGRMPALAAAWPAAVGETVDLERGATGLGPHLDDLGVLSAGRDLRTFGSQGEQRLAVLALLLGEAELLEERRGPRPLLLLDDVLSELDPERRQILADRVRASGQALVTSA